jgi:anti-sigma factor RsiW
MKVLTCAATRRRLHAYCDGELAVSDQIAVDSHLEWCDECAELHADLIDVGAALRASLPARIALSAEEESSLQAVVVSRMKAERTVSLASQAREMFEDMRLVYAAFGGAVAAVVCVVIMLGMMRFARELPATVAAAAPAIVRQAAALAPAPPAEPRIQLPRPLGQTFSAGTDIDGDSVIMMVAVVTREGTIANLSLLDPGGGRSSRQITQTKAIEDLLGAVSRARFEPGRVEGLPVAMNMVWVVERTTVRATRAGKKTASIAVHGRSLTV